MDTSKSEQLYMYYTIYIAQILKHFITDAKYLQIGAKQFYITDKSSFFMTVHCV